MNRNLQGNKCKLILSVLISFILILSSMSTISNAYAQEKTADIGADKIKAILLEQKIWIGEIQSIWGPCLHDYEFEDRGKKMIVKIDCPGRNISCKEKVKIKSAGFRITDCNAGIVDLFYDPNDPVYKFKTKDDNLAYDSKLKAKKF